MSTIFDKIFTNIEEEKIAIIEQDKKFTYKQFKKDCEILYIQLKKIIGTKKKICICLPNTYLNVVIFIVSSKLKYTIFPLNTNISNKNFVNYSKKYNFDVIFLDNKNLKKSVKKILPNKIIFNTNDIKKIINKNYSTETKVFYKINNNIVNHRYLIILSSGSTGDPKPIILSQKNKFLRSIYAGKTYNFKENEVVILPYQLDHSVGQRLMFMSLIHKGTLVIAKNFNEKTWFNLSHKYAVTFSILVSFHIKNIFQKKINLNKLHMLKNLVSVSDVLEDKIRKKIIKYSFNFHEIYGAAEISTVTNIKHRKNSQSKSVGKILPFVDLKIISKDNKILKDGLVGEIVCKTPLMFEKYYKREKATMKSFFKNYFKTGDLGYVRNNHLYFSGRIKNLIKISGLSIFPEDVENTLKKLKYINNCIVKAEYDSKRGQKIVAIIEGNKKKENEIYFYCIKNLEIHQIPTKFYFTSNIPKTYLGKIDRKLT